MSQEIIGIPTAELIEMMLSAGIHTSVDRFKALAIEIQQRALKAQDEKEKA
jgi:hypothetical protein